MIGVSTRTVLRWEQNTNKPGPEEAKKLASIIGITVDELMSDEDDITENLSEGAKTSVLENISDSVDNLVTAQEAINESLVITQRKDDRRHEELIGELKSQNELLLSKVETYEKRIENNKEILRYKKIQTIVIIVTCIIILGILIGTWIYWRNYGFGGDALKGSDEMGTPSYFQIDDDK